MPLPDWPAEKLVVCFLVGLMWVPPRAIGLGAGRKQAEQATKQKPGSNLPPQLLLELLPPHSPALLEFLP